ncbi:MAG: CoA-binding protein [Verrucomicrobiota bacterium]
MSESPPARPAAPAGAASTSPDPAAPAVFPRPGAAPGGLEVDLGPQAIWGDPSRARAHWAWIRDGRHFDRGDFSSFHLWITRFLALAGGASEPARHFQLGFVQGVECARRKVPLPAVVLAGVGSRQVPRPSDLPAAAGTGPLPALRAWAASWLGAGDGPWEQLGAWELGLVLASRAVRENHPLAPLVAAESDRTRTDHRFAAQALAGFLLHPVADLWQQFVRSTYPDGCPEGRVVAGATRRGLDHARVHRGSLREFLLHAVEAGRDFSHAHPHEAGRIAGGGGADQPPVPGGESTAGPEPDPSARAAEGFLPSLGKWLRTAHPDLFEPQDYGAGNLVLRHAYDHLWRQGVREGIGSSGQPTACPPWHRLKTVAVLGASKDPAKFSNRAVRAYLARGYRVYPVNPRETAIEGLPAWASVRDLPERPQRVSAYLPPPVLLRVLPEVAARGCDELWLNPGTDTPEVVAAAGALGLKVVQACSLVSLATEQ